jgi:tyrosine decarboxylase/aspartate 1-decarboxylase
MEPVMNVVGIKSDVLDTRRIAEELRLKEWAISLFPRHLRVVIMPHVREEHLNGLLQDLKSIVNELGG